MDAYSNRKQLVVRLIDIAIEAIGRYPPTSFNPMSLKIFVQGYLQMKDAVLNASARHRNMKSLSQTEHEVLTYFQEATGAAVEYFWQQIKVHEIECKRENRLARIVERGRVRNEMEFDLVVDLLVPYHQNGMINDQEFKLLSTMINDFENRSRK